MKRTSQKHLFFFYCVILILFAFTGIYMHNTAIRKKDNAPITDTRFALNTVVTITLYDSQDTKILDEAFRLCDKYEAIFSRTMTSSELYRINHATKTALQISDELASLVRTGLSYSSLSKGAFDISIAPVSQLWDFTSEIPVVPQKSEIEKQLTYVGYQNFSIAGNTLKKHQLGNQLDLGAIAKGYIADRIKDFLLTSGVNNAVISLGGNILCIGDKNGDCFNIGIQAPFKEHNVTLATLKIKNKSIVTSGIYERCFTQDDKFYHHILNPKTGYPYDNELSSVTIISDKSVDGDALSTTCFALGLKEGLAYINSHEAYDAIFVDYEGKIHYSDNLRKNYNIK